VVDYLAGIVVDAVDTALVRSMIPRGMDRSESTRVSNFNRFTWNFLQKASARMSAILVTLVYLTRAKKHLRIEAEDRAYERVLLGAFIVASKYSSDTAFRSLRWVMNTILPGKQPTLGKRDVNRIEREFLAVLDWQLGFTEEHILAHKDAIIGLYCDPSSSATPRPTSRTVITPPVGRGQLKDTSTPIRKSMADYDLSTPRNLLYPAVLAAQPFLSGKEQKKHSRPCASDLPAFPPISWRGNNRPMHAQHTAPRIYG
jgi:hypothetical protein